LVLVQASTALERDPTAALAWLKQHPGGDALPALRTVASDALARGIASHVLRRHEGRVTGLAFGADAAHLFSAGSDGTLFGEDLAAGKSRELVAPPGILWVLARAPSGKTIAVTGTGGFVRIISDDLPERRLELGAGNPLALEFSPDGRFLAAGTVSGEVWLWNVDTGERRDLKGHSAEVRDLAFSRDGARVASASFDGTVQLTALATGESKQLRLGTEEVWSVDFGADGVLAAASDDGVVRLFDKTGARLAELSGHKGPIVDLSFSPDGQMLATASRDRTVRVWAAPFKEPRVLEGHSSDVLKAVFSPDGRTLASASADRTVRLWDLTSTDVRVLLGHEGSVSLLAFAPDSSAVATAGLDGSVRVWKVAGAGERIARGFTKAVVSPRGTSFAGVQADGKLTVVDAQGEAHQIPGAGWRFVGFGDEEHLAAVDGNREVVLWDAAAKTSRTLDRIPVDVGSAVIASGWLALSAWDGTLRLRRLSDGAGRVWKGHKTYTLVADASPDGTLIASGGDEGDVKLWNVATGDSRTFAGDKNPVHSVRFSPDGKKLATGDINGEVRIWDVAKGAVLLEQKDRSFVRAVAFSSDGALLVSGGDDKKVRVRDVKSGQTLALLEGAEQPVFDLAFSPDSSLVAVGSADQTVRVFEWNKTGAARVLRGHRATVSRVLFTADGATLTSVDEGGSVRRWTREEFAPLPDDRAELAKWMAAQTTVQIDAEHRATSVAP
jgi:WD40 repeat protein